MRCQKLIADNIIFLQQGIDLLASIDDEAYVKTEASCYASSAGKHIRHNLDLFDCFIAGLPRAAIDYDARPRGTAIETSRGIAIKRMQNMIARLESMKTADPDMRLRVDMNRDGESMTWTESTLARELQFLISHTVHHYAIIAMILKMQNIDPNISGFGVAPSTLKYERGIPTAKAAWDRR